MFQRWDICRAYVEYEEKSGGKRRPVLVINVGIDTFISFKITKNISRDDDLEYKIIKWQDAGLDCPSCVRLGHKVYFSTLDHLVKLGRLQKVDIDNIKILCQKYDIKLNEDLNVEKIDWDKVQWGVHQFSTNSIIFRGTEEECAKYIDDRPELWDDAEVYFMTPDDPHYIKEQRDQELEESMKNKKLVEYCSDDDCEDAWAYEVYRVLDGELLATDGGLKSYEVAVKYAEETAQAYEEQGYGECSYDVFEDKNYTPVWNRKKTVYESKQSIEDYDIQEDKGFELDLDIDLTDQELEEDMEYNKKYIVFDHFNPEILYFVKNIPQDSWIWDSDYIIEDVTDKHGNCLIENNDEYISVGEMGNKTLSDFDKEIIASLKKAIEENPDEEYLCAYTSEDREFCFEKDELPDDLDSMTPFTDFVENSYVDGDSNSQYQVINLDTEEFGEFGVDIFADEEDGIDEEDHKTYPEYSWYTSLKNTLKTDYEKYPEREDHYLAIFVDLDSKLKKNIINTLQDLGAKNIDFIGNYVGDRVYFEMSPKVLKRIYNNMINGFNIFGVDEDEDLEEGVVDKTYAVTVKYHNEPARIEARLAKDREDLEYQLNMDDEVEWYDFDEEQFTESCQEIVENKLENSYNINERVAPSSSFVELEGFKRDWENLGLNDDDLRDLQNLIINNPSSSIPLGSNVYKIRFSPERLNRGKDTANRVIYIEVIKSNVIYLATAFSKSEEANISKKEEDTLRAFAKILNK